MRKKKELEITICNYRPLHSIRCPVCHKFIKHICHSRKHKVEKRQRTCRSKECLRLYPKFRGGLKYVKKKKNKQQRERYRDHPEVREKIRIYNNSLERKLKKKEYYQQNKEWIKAKVMEYYLRNREKIIMKNRKKRNERMFKQ